MPTWLSPKEAPDFWIVAVLISILIDIPLALVRPEIFSAYTIAEVIAIYVGCLLAGLVLYGAGRALINHRLRKADLEYGEHTFLGTETPLDVLRRLASRGLGLVAPQLDQDVKDGFVVAWQGTEAVIVPQIIVRASLPVGTRERVQKLIDRGPPDIAGIVSQLSAAPGAWNDGVVFRGGGRVTVKALDHAPGGPAGRIITVED